MNTLFSAKEVPQIWFLFWQFKTGSVFSCRVKAWNIFMLSQILLKLQQMEKKKKN